MKTVNVDLTDVILVPETNTQRVAFANPKAGVALKERLAECGWLPQFAMTFALASELPFYTAEQIAGFKESCRASRQARLDALRMKAHESDEAQLAYEGYKAMFAKGKDQVPEFGKNAKIPNDGNQRLHLLFEAEVMRVSRMKAEAKLAGTKYEPDWVTTVPGEYRKFATSMEWFYGQAGANITAESKVNVTILDRIKALTEAYRMGAAFEKVSSLCPAGDSRQRAPFAARVNQFTGGELLRRMLLPSTDADHIAEGSIFASGLKDRFTIDDRIQIVVCKFDAGRRTYFKANNAEEWNKAAEGKESKSVTKSLVDIHNGDLPEWTADDVKAWLASISKKGLENRAATPVDNAATKALKTLQSDVLTQATYAGNTAKEIAKGLVGTEAERGEFNTRMEKLGPVLDVVTGLFNADQIATIELADQLRGIDLALLPNIVAAVKKVVSPTPAPQGGKTRKAGK